MDRFADIRPFIDNETADAVIAILADDDFISAILRLRRPYLPNPINFLALPLMRYALKRQLKGVSSPSDFQQRMFPYFDYMASTTINKISVSGLEQLPTDKNYLFISNHRDITLDAALIGRILFKQLNKTPLNAIGDNLLKPNFVGTLLRLNKCFTVSRHISSPRKRLANLHHLSAYIHFCLTENNHCVWLAQKAGRAKDGLDKTDHAIIKMLAMSKSSDETFSHFIKSLNIVPVSISYEYDPCDIAKANELYMLATTGNYTKTEHEDFESIAMGILGYKGNVHLSIGNILSEKTHDVNAVTNCLDQQIIGNYNLHTSNLFAYQRLYDELPESIHHYLKSSTIDKEKRIFEKRLNAVPDHLKEYWLTIYANPVASKIRLMKTSNL
jgi:hypothetical protein